MFLFLPQLVNLVYPSDLWPTLEITGLRHHQAALSTVLCHRPISPLKSVYSTTDRGGSLSLSLSLSKSIK